MTFKIRLIAVAHSANRHSTEADNEYFQHLAPPPAFPLQPCCKITTAAISAHHANHPDSTRKPHPNRYLQPE